MRIICVRYGIEAALGEWAAASETLKGEERAAASAVPRDGFLRVIRAGGIKLARAPEERGEKNLIQPNEREQKPRADGQGARRRRAAFYSGGQARGSNLSSSVASGENSAVAAEARG